MSDIPTWGLFALGVISTIGAGTVIVVVSRYSSKLFKNKSVRDVVDSANAVIQMYEKHVGALELEVNSLKEEISKLKEKLDETLKHNEALQKLLLASPAVQVLPHE